MKRKFLLALSLLILIPGPAAAEFSLYGVTMGMPREQVEARWKRIDSGLYYVENSVLLNVAPEFDHMDRLYRLNFSVPIPLLDRFPREYVSTSFQELLQERWSEEGFIVNLRTARGEIAVTITSRELMNEYLQHIRGQLLIQLGVLLKP